MPKIQMRYQDVRATFLNTEYGKLQIELAVGATKVIVKDDMGIKGSIPVADLAESQNTLVLACKEADPELFDDLIKRLGD
jgi:hypothetical protein